MFQIIKLGVKPLTLKDLEIRLLNDLKTLNINTENLELVVKPYSKSYYGRFYPKNNRIFVYPYRNPDRTCMYPYTQLFKTALHEAVHFIQWNDPDYVRIKGVMHNEEFYRIYNKLENQYKRKLVMKRVKLLTEVRVSSY